MPQAIPALAAAAATSAGLTGVQLAAVTIFSSSLVSTAMADHQADAASRRAQAAAAAAARNRNITVRSSVAPRRYVLGTARISGPLMYAEFVGDDLQYLDSIVALTQGELSEVLGVYVGDEYIAVADIAAGIPTTGKYSLAGGTDPVWLEESFNIGSAVSVLTLEHVPLPTPTVVMQTGIEPDLVQVPITVSSLSGYNVNLASSVSGIVHVRYATIDAVYSDPLRVQWAMGSSSQATTTWSGVSTPKWTADHRLRGVSYVRTLKLIDHPLFLAGDSGDVGVVARGPKGVYDPRTTTTVDYTSNPALLAAWWRTLPTADGGLGVPSAWIDWDTVADAANVCDELISVRQLDGTGYENVKRYECHTVLSLDLPPLDNLQVILDSMAGDFPFTGGKYRCYAGAFRAAALTLTDDDIAQEEPLTFAPLASDGETPPNIATARFYDGQHGWVETQARPVQNTTYITADGEQEPLELDLLASTDERQANYLMGVRLERRRPALAGTVTVTGKGADLALLDALQFDLDGYSAIAAKTFEVRRRTNHWNGRYTLNLREVKASTYALDADRFTPADVVTVADNSVLFAVDMPVIDSVGEQLVRQADGSLISRAVLVLQPHTQASVLERGQIQLRWAAAGAAWVYGSPLAGRETVGTTGALNVNTLVTVQARAINASGVPSGWAGADPLPIDGTVTAPAVVAGFTSTVSKGRIAWTWDRCADADYNVTEVRSSDANWGSTSVQPLYRGKANGWPEVVTATGTLTRYARHFNASGLYSSSVAGRAQVVAGADLVQDGTSGTSVYTATVYLQIGSPPSAPTGGSYNFSTGTLTAPASWSVTQPATTTTPTYACEFTFSTTTPASTVTAGTWTTPYIDAVAGAGGGTGATGESVLVMEVFLQNATLPSTPSGGSYNFSTDSFTAPAGGWSRTMPASSTTPTWRSVYRFATNTPGTSVAAGAYGTPAVVAQNGANGQDAIASTLSLRYFGLLADTAGTVASFSGAATTVSVTKGGVDDTANWTWSKADSGVTSSLAGTTATVSAMSADIGNVTITGVDTRSIYPDVIERFDLAKLKTEPVPGPVVPGPIVNCTVGTVSPTTCVAGVRFTTAGQVARKASGTSSTYTDVTPWYYPAGTPPITYYIRLRGTTVGGTLAGTGLTWNALTSNRTVTLTATSGQVGDATIAYDISADAAGALVLSTGTFELHAEST